MFEQRHVINIGGGSTRPPEKPIGKGKQKTKKNAR